MSMPIEPERRQFLRYFLYLCWDRPNRRHGGGRPDPLADFWDREILPMIEAAPKLRPVTVLEEMKRRHPDHDWDSMRRTLERRMREWKGLHGPVQEVIFRQDHPIGQQGMSDFCVMDGLGITVAGQLFRHRIFHFALVYSGWEYADVVQLTLTVLRLPRTREDPGMDRMALSG